MEFLYRALVEGGPGSAALASLRDRSMAGSASLADPGPEFESWVIAAVHGRRGRPGQGPTATLAEPDRSCRAVA